MTFNLSAIRNQFPSLNKPAIFLDNPSGTQIAKPSLDRISKYLLDCNANHEGGSQPASHPMRYCMKLIKPWLIFITLHLQWKIRACIFRRETPALLKDEAPEDQRTKQLGV